jgi:hypothetical protein
LSGVVRSPPGHSGHDPVASSSLSLPSLCSRNGSRSGRNHGSNRSHAGSRRGTVAMIIVSSRCRGRRRAAVTVAIAVAIAVATIAVAVVMTLPSLWPSSRSRGHRHHHHHCLRLQPRRHPPNCRHDCHCLRSCGEHKRKRTYLMRRGNAE